MAFLVSALAGLCNAFANENAALKAQGE